VGCHGKPDVGGGCHYFDHPHRVLGEGNPRTPDAGNAPARRGEPFRAGGSAARGSHGSLARRAGTVAGTQAGDPRSRL